MNAQTKVTPAAAATTFDEAFVKLQSELGPARKLANNPAFKSKYADLGAVWDAIMGPLHSNGFGLMQIHQFEGETDYLETVLIHAPSRGRVTGRYRLRPTRQDPQGYGSATTYARRYAACAMLGVVADEDDDGNAASAPASKPSAAAPTQRDAIHTPMQEDPDITEGVKNWCEKEKGKIAMCARLPDLLMWKDEREAELHRLFKKAPKAHRDLMDYFQMTQALFDKKEAAE